jgi:protein-tyrosine phosphatase
MAEFVFKDMVKQRGLEDKFYIASAATSREEIGNPVHHGTRNKLKEHGIGVEGKYAIQLSKKDSEKYDYIIGMEQINLININKIIGENTKNKVSRLLDFTNNPRDIADPWYTGNFDKTYRDIMEGCEALLDECISSHMRKEN